MTLDDLWQVIEEQGPQRVIINDEADAVPLFRARRDYKIDIKILFIRDDGWTLAAPVDLEAVAYKLWKDKWIGFSVYPFRLPRPITEYKDGAAQPKQAPCPPCMDAWKGRSDEVHEERAKGRGR